LKESENESLYWPIPKDIPAKFYSEDNHSFFQNCTVCDKNLLESNTTYLIEKAYKRVNQELEHVVFEYAICMDCAQEMNSKISKESLNNMKEYYSQYFNSLSTVERMKLFKQDDDFWQRRCLVKNTPMGELTEYNICGLFQGKTMLVGEFPYIISIEAMDELVSILSEETKDEFDDFKRTYLDGPPELQELLKGRPVLVI
jgi:hypothetical protein